MYSETIKNQLAEDILYVKSLLPKHYTVIESKSKSGSLRCVSPEGIRHKIDADDVEHFGYIVSALKQHFAGRFQEVDHNVNFCHKDFTIFLKQKPHE